MLCSFSLRLIFCSEQPFYGNYSTLDSHTNTVFLTRLTTRQDGVENRDKAGLYDPGNTTRMASIPFFFQTAVIGCSKNRCRGKLISQPQSIFVGSRASRKLLGFSGTLKKFYSVTQ